MSPYRRNILVGVTVLAALIFLGGMILKFGDRPAQLFAAPTMPVRFVASNAEGISQGSPITYQGVAVGRVLDVRRSDNLREVIINGVVDRAPPLPANVVGRIRAQSLLGAGSVIALTLTGPDPAGELQPGATLPAEYIGIDVLPPEFARLARELEDTARQIRESNLVPNLNAQVTKLGHTIDSVNELVGDEQMRADLRATLANVRQATASADRVAANLEQFSVQLQQLGTDAGQTLDQAQSTIATTEQRITAVADRASERIEQVAELLQTFQEIAAKVNQGQGTAGLLINDPQLYRSLVDTAQELDLMMSDLRRLVEQWEQEGVSLRLGG